VKKHSAIRKKTPLVDEKKKKRAQKRIQAGYCARNSTMLPPSLPSPYSTPFKSSTVRLPIPLSEIEMDLSLFQPLTPITIKTIAFQKPCNGKTALANRFNG
jgi:hypothetical protein